jgi:hypothetical protein
MTKYDKIFAILQRIPEEDLKYIFYQMKLGENFNFQ